MDAAATEDVVVELDLPARPEVVSVARMVIASLVFGDRSFGEERVDDIRLAVSEACTNAVEAHLAKGDGKPVHVSVRLVPGEVTVAVRDYGGGFDPGEVVVPADLADPGRLDREGGLGIPLIRLLSDRLEFRQTEDGTEVVMTFGTDAVRGRVA